VLCHLRHTGLCYARSHETVHTVSRIEAPMENYGEMRQTPRHHLPSICELRAERQGSGAAKSGSEVRADAVCRRLHPLVGHGRAPANVQKPGPFSCSYPLLCAV